MPRYEVTSPTGERYEIDTGDEEASEQDLFSYAEKHGPAPEIKQKGFLGRTFDRLKTIPSEMAEGAKASGEFAPGAGMEGMPGQEPTRQPGPGLGGLGETLEPLGIFAPGMAIPRAAGEAARPAGQRAGRQYLESGTITPGMEGIDLEQEDAPMMTPEAREDFVRTAGESASTGTEFGSLALLPPFAMTRGAMAAQKLAMAGKVARVSAIQGLTDGLSLLKERKIAEGITEASSQFDTQVQALQKALPERGTGAIEQPGQVGQKALPRPRELPQFAEAAQEADAARRAGMKARAAEQTEQVKGAIQPEYAGRIEARKGRAAHQLDILREQFQPQAPRHMEFGEAGDIVRQDVRRMSGSNEEILARMTSGEEGAELTKFLREAIDQGASGEWIKAGELSPDDLRSLMRLKNRNLLEVRGPKGQAEYKLTADADHALFDIQSGRPVDVPYLKEKVARGVTGKAQLNEIANEFYGKPLQKLTKAEAQNLESLTPQDIAELRKGMRPISGGAERFPGAENFRREEVITNSERYISQPEPRYEPGFKGVRHQVTDESGKQVARVFSWTDQKTGATGISDIVSMQPGLGKGGLIRAIKAAGGDSKWVHARMANEGATQATLDMFDSLAELGLINLQRNVHGDITLVRLGAQAKNLRPNPHKVAKLAHELDIRPAKGMEIDPTTGSMARRDVRGLRDTDPEFTRRVHAAAAGETNRAYNSSASAARAMQAKNIDELATIREILKGDVEDVLTRALDVATGDTPAARAGLGDAIKRLLDSRAAAQGTPALATKSLSILKQMEKNVKAADAIASGLAKFNAKKPGYVDNVARFLTDLEDTAAKGKVSFGDGVFFTWLNGRLSGPWTHVKNQVSNTARLAVRPITRGYAGAIDMAHSAMTGAPRQIYAGEALADVVGIMHGIPEAARSMMRVWGKGPSQSIFGSTTKLEFLRLAGQPKGKLGSIVGSPGRAMVAADEFYKVLSYEGSVAAQMYRASKQVGGAVDNIADDVLASIAKQASMEADLTTYTNRLSERGKLGHTLSGLSKLRGRVGRYIVPFFNTNTNVILEGLAHTPVLGFGTAGHQTGEIAMRGFKGSLAKQMAGTTGAVGAALMIKAMGGQITGGGPSDPNARKTLMASGWKPYSIKVPGLPAMSMTEVTGLFNVLGMVGDAYDLAEEGVIDMEDAAQRISKSIIKQYSYPPFASGIQDLLDVWQDGDIMGDVAKKWLQRQASTVVPAGVGFLAQIQDPTIRRPGQDAPYGGVGQAVQSNVPYAQEGTPALRDIWGREIKRTLGPLEAILGGTQPEITAVDDEVKRLAKIQDADGTSLLAIGGTVAEIQDVELTSDEYDTYQARAGELARLSVTAMISQPRWNNLSDEARAKAIKGRFTKARKKARREIKRESDTLRDRIRETSRAARRRRKAPRAPGKALEEIRRRNQ